MHLAQINVARMIAPITDPVMASFVARLAEINALADCSPGFIWRLQTPEGNATYIRPYRDDRILVNMSVWESIEQLKDYTYRTAHAELLRDRKAWFERFSGPQTAMWWVPVGHVPDLEEAKERLASLTERGPTPYAFTFSKVFHPG